MGGLEEYGGNTGWKLISGSSLDELMRYDERFPLDLWLRGYKPLILARQKGTMPGIVVSRLNTSRIPCLHRVEAQKSKPFTLTAGPFMLAIIYVQFRTLDRRTEMQSNTTLNNLNSFFSSSLVDNPASPPPDCISPHFSFSIAHAYFITPACPNAPTSSTQPAYSSPQSRQPGTLHLVLRRPCKN